MTGWTWLTEFPYRWAFVGRVLLKAAALFVILNLIFASVNWEPILGRVSIYNTFLPGRERLPYGENPAQSYNLSLNNVTAMLEAHVVARGKKDDEFRLLVIGDSSVWGVLLRPEDTLAGRINAGNYRTADGQRVVAYNLGHPIITVMKDLLILDAALAYEPDMILWLVTLDALPQEKQLYPPIVQQNAEQIRELIERYDLNVDPQDMRLVDRDFQERTIIGRRRDLADWLRLQMYAVPWYTTGIDQFYPEEYTPRTEDFDEDISWQGYDEPAPITDLSFDVIRAGIEHAGAVPVLLVNEPMFISTGENSDLRYNFFYPRWAYDQYRELLAGEAATHGWDYLDLWDAIPAEEFTDSPVHMTPEGETLLAEIIMQEIVEE